MTLEVVILAAGQGTRMRSNLPKVLHCLAGKPLVQHVIDTAAALHAERVHVVVGHGGDAVRESLSDARVQWVTQEQQLGTGHAVAQALPNVDPQSTVLVLYGDVPLVRADTLQALVDAADEQSLALLTVQLADPTGYGRIVREGGSVRAIVEQKDASPEQLAITEVNTGILAVKGSHLQRWLPRLSANNAQGEYYLTDTIAMAVADGLQVTTAQPERSWEVEGVNNRAQLGALERIYQNQIAGELMAAGATLADAARIDVRGELSVGRDVFIDVGCVFEGEVEIADEVAIGPYCVIRNAAIGPGVTIDSHTVIDGAAIAAGATVGPFARLRPGTELDEGAKVGNFVEVKKATVGPGSKVNHLSYIGDTAIGRDANIGAGTITCNYDGANKYRTEIGDRAFIGSNSALVAPVSVGRGATVAAGSTITGDVGDEQLAVARGRQRNIDGWRRPEKK